MNKIKQLETSDFTEVIKFLKKELKNRHKSNISNFWISNVPINHFYSLLNSNLWKSIIYSYFSNDEHVNNEFLQLVISSKKANDFIEVIKLNKVFHKSKHWKSLEVLKNSRNLKLRQVYKELQYVKNNFAYWEELNLGYTQKLKLYSFEDIIIQFTLFFQRFKNSISNHDLITSQEDILAELLSNIITKKHFKNSKVNSISSFYNQLLNDNEVFQKKPNTEFEEIINFLFNKHANNYHINKYLASYAEFEFIDGMNAELKTNTDYIKYKKSLDKVYYEENYTSNLSQNDLQINILDFSEYFIALKNASSLNYFEFYNIPTQTSKGNKIDIQKTLKILNTLSTNLLPCLKTLTKREEIYFDIAPNFKKLFKSDIICCFEKSELIKKITNYFNYPLEETKTIIEFLSVNIESKKEINIRAIPFVEKDGKLFWLSAFLKDRKWENIIHNRLLNEKLIDKNKLAKNAEIILEQLLSDSGFSTKKGHQYKNLPISGEIDLLAYKNNTLFIIEVKTSVIKEDMLETKKFEYKTFKNEASNQLNNALQFVKDKFDEVQKLLNIKSSLEDIQISTLIVSNAYQGDNQKFDNDNHLKACLFELSVILKNNLYNMLIDKKGEPLFDLPNLNLDSILGYNNPSFNKESCNLWKNSISCKPNDIIEAITKNKVFKNIDAHQKHYNECIEIGEYNPSIKYLS